MTDSSIAPTPKRASRADSMPTAKPASAPKPARPARPGKPAKPAAIAPAPEPAHRHPNLGKPPLDVTAGFPAAAAALRADRATIAAGALEAAAAADPEFRGRFGEAGMAQLLHDAEVLVDRLAMSVASNDPRPTAEYAEWVGPIFRRRGVSLWDVAAVCEGIREIAASRLGEAESAAMGRAVDAAVEVLRKNGRLGGDGHKRNALLKWLYRGV